MQRVVGLVFGIIVLGIFSVGIARLLGGRTVYFSTYRAVAVYVPILVVLGIGIALAMFLRWRRARRGTNAT